MPTGPGRGKTGPHEEIVAPAKRQHETPTTIASTGLVPSTLLRTRGRADARRAARSEACPRSSYAGCARRFCAVAAEALGFFLFVCHTSPGCIQESSFRLLRS